jgi:hypothetical protein
MLDALPNFLQKAMDVTNWRQGIVDWKIDYEKVAQSRSF